MLDWILIYLSYREKTLGSFKWYVHSKLLIFDPLFPCPSLFILQVTPFSLNIYVRFSELPQASQKKSQDAYKNQGVIREKIIFSFS